MKIEEAINQLRDLQEDRKSFMADEEEKDSVFVQDYEAIETVLSELEKLQKENEELKNEIEEKELEIIGKEEYTKASMREIIEQYYTANEDCVPTQKIKYLIDERAFEVYTRDYGNIDVVDVDSLNELLEEVKKSNKK